MVEVDETQQAQGALSASKAPLAPPSQEKEAKEEVKHGGKGGGVVKAATAADKSTIAGAKSAKVPTLYVRNLNDKIKVEGK